MRYWEIDFARGVAVVLMVAYHIFFDMYYFGKIVLEGPFWYYFPRFIASMFIFISGYTLSIVCRRACARRVIRKVAKLSALAVLITLVTYIFVRSEYVEFGILHFFSVATFLGLIFVGRPKLSFVVGLLVFTVGVYLQQQYFSIYWLLWLGLIPRDFYTLDYFPLFPWFGVFLLGMSLGNFHRPIRNVDFPIRNLVVFLGKNSLKVYLLQHPVILLFLQLYYGDIIQRFLSF